MQVGECGEPSSTSRACSSVGGTSRHSKASSLGFYQRIEPCGSIETKLFCSPTPRGALFDARNNSAISGKKKPPAERHIFRQSGYSHPPYSPECVEGKFSEV